MNPQLHRCQTSALSPTELQYSGVNTRRNFRHTGRVLFHLKTIELELLSISRAPLTGRLRQPSWVRFLEMVYFLSRNHPTVGEKWRGAGGPGKLPPTAPNAGFFLFLATAYCTHVWLVGVRGASRNERNFTKALLMTLGLVPPVSRLAA